MHYATHCVGPCLALTRRRPSTSPASARARIREELIAEIQLAVRRRDVPHQAHGFRRDGSHLSARCSTRPGSTARASTSIGTKKTFEWPLIEGEEPVLHTAKKPEPEIPERVKVPDYAHLLPEAIRRFTTKGVYDAGEHAPVVHPGRRPRRLASAPGPRIRPGAGRKTAIRTPTRCSRPTGRASASAPTSRR